MSFPRLITVMGSYFLCELLGTKCTHKLRSTVGELQSSLDREWASWVYVFAHKRAPIMTAVTMAVIVKVIFSTTDQHHGESNPESILLFRRFIEK